MDLSTIDWRAEVTRVHEGQAKIKGRPPWDADDRRFLVNALGGEVGELANLVKKAWRGDEYGRTRQWRDAVREEAADARIYLQLAAMAYSVDLTGCELLQFRYPADAETVLQRADFLSLQMLGSAGKVALIVGNVWLSPSVLDEAAVVQRDVAMVGLGGLLAEFSRLRHFDLDQACRDQLPKIWRRWPHSAPPGVIVPS